MQTPAQADRAIVLPGRTYPCPCGCGRQIPDPNGSCGVPLEPGVIAMPSLTAAVAGDIDAAWLQSAQHLFDSPGEAVGLSVRLAAAERLTWKALKMQVDKEVQDLLDLAQEQGWPTPVIDGTKIKWTNPEGGQVSTPTRVVGRGLNNLKTQLRRLGLEIPNPQKKASPVEVVPDPATDPVADEPEGGDPAQDPWAALAVLTQFVTDKQGDGDWPALCEDLERELHQTRAERDEMRKLVDDIKTALTTTAPWQALPAIAALLGLSEEKTA